MRYFTWLNLNCTAHSGPGEVFLWLPSFCSRGQAALNAQGPRQPALLPCRHPAAALASDPATLRGACWSWGVKGGFRRTKEALTCDTVYRSATELCQCARVLWFWVGSRIEAKPSLQPLSLSLPYLFLYFPAWAGYGAGLNWSPARTVSDTAAPELQQSQSFPLGLWWICRGSARMGSALSSARLLRTLELLGFF